MKGEILGWVNADDVYLPGAIHPGGPRAAGRPRPGAGLRQRRVHRRRRAPAGQGGARHPGRRQDLRSRWATASCSRPPSSAARPTRRWAAWNPPCTTRVDYDLWLLLAQQFPCRHLDATLAQVRLVPTTKTASGGWEQWPRWRRWSRQRTAAAVCRAWFGHRGLRNARPREPLSAVRQARLGAASASAVAALRTCRLPRHPGRPGPAAHLAHGAPPGLEGGRRADPASSRRRISLTALGLAFPISFSTAPTKKPCSCTAPPGTSPPRRGERRLDLPAGGLEGPPRRTHGVLVAIELGALKAAVHPDADECSSPRPSRRTHHTSVRTEDPQLGTVGVGLTPDRKLAHSRLRLVEPVRPGCIQTHGSRGVTTNAHRRFTDR